MDISIIKIVESTTVDGPGLRTTIYAAGCSHHCPGCHNPQTWDIAAGTMTPVHEVAQRLLDNEFEDITFSGGDPFYQAEAFGELAQIIKQSSEKSIWCYTGYLFETLLSDPRYISLLKNIDVLIDGPYVAKLRNTDLLFRGSENQRIIDVRKSLKSGTTIEYSPSILLHALMELQ